MSNRYPCPNPICTYEFDPEQLAGAASVTCPKCGIVIQLRAQPAAATVTAPAAVPLARPIALPAPGGKWDQNPALRNAMDGSLLAFQRSDPPAWFVLAARDYKDHDPSPRELDDEARARLGAYFKNISTEPAKDAPLRAADPVA